MSIKHPERWRQPAAPVINYGMEPGETREPTAGDWGLTVGCVALAFGPIILILVIGSILT